MLDRFVLSGCELRIAEATVRMPDGDCLNVRYLLNPANGMFVPLVDLDDSDSVSEGEVAFWERRLGVLVSRPEET